jgi:hypothetical protein
LPRPAPGVRAAAAAAAAAADGDDAATTAVLPPAPWVLVPPRPPRPLPRPRAPPRPVPRPSSPDAPPPRVPTRTATSRRAAASCCVARCLACATSCSSKRVRSCASLSCANRRRRGSSSASATTRLDAATVHVAILDVRRERAPRPTRGYFRWSRCPCHDVPPARPRRDPGRAARGHAPDGRAQGGRGRARRRWAVPDRLTRVCWDQVTYEQHAVQHGNVLTPTLVRSRSARAHLLQRLSSARAAVGCTGRQQARGDVAGGRGQAVHAHHD